MQKLKNKVGALNGNEYENYRWFFTSGDVLVVGGKSDEQNEAVIANFLRPEYIIMHTTEPGSSFMIIQSEKPGKKDLEETAVFCACFSQQWKKGDKLISIDIFKGEQVYKNKSMKTGTFGVMGEKKTMKVKPELVLVIQKGKLRAVPTTTKEEKLTVVVPGKLSKEEAAIKIARAISNKYHFPVSRDEIMQAIPSDKIGVKG
jgi:hypothetical protein